jgi:hypothetical protein
MRKLTFRPAPQNRQNMTGVFESICQQDVSGQNAADISIGRFDRTYCETDGLALDKVVDSNSMFQMNVFSKFGASLYIRRLHQK